MKATVVSCVLAGLLVGPPLVARADTLVAPLAYSFDQETDCGGYCYYDDTGSQLTDSAYGRAGWAANLGNGIAYEWVGWIDDSPVNIDFDFGSTKNITKVSIGTTQDTIDDVVLPSVDVFQKVGTDWVLAGSLNVPESSTNDNDVFSTAPHTFLDLSGLGISSQYVRVSLRHSSDGPWTFVDEVSFYASAAPVPEPEAYALMLAGLGLVGFMARRRKVVAA